jgi:hypothetical protein
MDLARRRRRRRRRQDRPPVSAHLLFDERMKEDVGLVSEDLYAELFPAKRSGQGRLHPVLRDYELGLTDLISQKIRMRIRSDMWPSRLGFRRPWLRLRIRRGQSYLSKSRRSRIQLLSRRVCLSGCQRPRSPSSPSCIRCKPYLLERHFLERIH